MYPAGHVHPCPSCAFTGVVPSQIAPTAISATTKVLNDFTIAPTPKRCRVSNFVTLPAISRCGCYKNTTVQGITTEEKVLVQAIDLCHSQIGAASHRPNVIDY